MRVFIISTANMGPELQCGLIGVVGSAVPSQEEKVECVEAVSRYVSEGWGIAANPQTVIGRLAALTAEAAGVPFVGLGRLAAAAMDDKDLCIRIIQPNGARRSEVGTA